MRDYESTLKQARTCANRKYCDIGANCEYYDAGVCCQGGEKDILNDAADAIEELLAAVRSVVRCKECEWWTKQEASIQGRCARLAIYPTGEFYCASGSKREPPKGVE